jgi:hypothetical protein
MIKHEVLCTSRPGFRPDHHTWPLMVAINQTHGKEIPTHLRYQFVLEGAVKVDKTANTFYFW